MFVWTSSAEGRAKGEKDKIAMLHEQEGKLQDLKTRRRISVMEELRRDGGL